MSERGKIGLVATHEPAPPNPACGLENGNPREPNQQWGVHGEPQTATKWFHSTVFDPQDADLRRGDSMERTVPLAELDCHWNPRETSGGVGGTNLSPRGAAASLVELRVVLRTTAPCSRWRLFTICLLRGGQRFARARLHRPRGASILHCLSPRIHFAPSICTPGWRWMHTATVLPHDAFCICTTVCIVGWSQSYGKNKLFSQKNIIY
jgi:hypothetical protein